MNGKLIVIEGSDGVGKRTQLELLQTYCQEHSLRNVVFDFPQYEHSFFGEMCQSYLHGEYGDLTTISPYLAALPYAADRWSVKAKIEIALGEGAIVIANRYTPSNAAYQAARLPESKRSAFLEWIGILEYEVFGLPREDLVIYLYLPLSISRQLLAARGKPMDGNETDNALLNTVEQLYSNWSETIAHWQRIDCSNGNDVLAKETIHLQIVDVMKRRTII